MLPWRALRARVSSAKNLTPGHTRKFIHPPWYKGERAVWMESLPGVFDMLQYAKRFYLQWKAFDLLNKTRYILWVVALLGACDNANNGHHLGRHLGFYRELDRLRRQEMAIFCALHDK